LLRGDTPATQGVSIALDEDVQLSRGPVGLAVTAASDVIDFPYCLLEVASDRGEVSGAWLEELRSHAALRGVPGFSIGAHAVAALHKEQVPELPHWYQHLTNVESSAPPEAWGLMLEWRAAVREKKDAPDAGADGAAAAAALADEAARLKSPQVVSAPTPAGPKKKEKEAPPKAPPKQTEQEAFENQEVAPKNFLASERTMLEWMHTVIALAFLGIGLWRVSLESGNPRPVAFGLINAYSKTTIVLGCHSLLLVALAVGFAWYAVLKHAKRLRALFLNEHTEGIFNARGGPLIFAFAVGAALVIHVSVQIIPLFAASAG